MEQDWCGRPDVDSVRAAGPGVADANDGLRTSLPRQALMRLTVAGVERRNTEPTMLELETELPMLSSQMRRFSLDLRRYLRLGAHLIVNPSTALNESSKIWFPKEL